MRIDGRTAEQLRVLTIEKGTMPYAEGSALICMGNTRVICSATIEEGVPEFLRGKGQGWLTAEYAMLPRATQKRKKRAQSSAKLDGRSTEIQRLIGRSLRACLDLDLLGEYTVTLDCDVLQADGGTRTASISGAYVALYQALQSIGLTKALRGNLAAVSVGMVNEQLLLDLCYQEDSRAQVDMNIVMLGDAFVELQGTAEGKTFSRAQMNNMMDLAQVGINEIYAAQAAALGLNK